MKKTASFILFSTLTMLLIGCQSTSQLYNGKTGYQVEQQTASSATLSYTLASDRNPNAEARKLQHACQQTLGKQKTYTIKILDTQEILSPVVSEENTGIQIGKSNTSFGFSNTPNLNNNQEAYANRQVEETRPTLLKHIRFTCA